MRPEVLEVPGAGEPQQQLNESERSKRQLYDLVHTQCTVNKNKHAKPVTTPEEIDTDRMVFSAKGDTIKLDKFVEDEKRRVDIIKDTVKNVKNAKNGNVSERFLPDRDKEGKEQKKQEQELLPSMPEELDKFSGGREALYT